MAVMDIRVLAAGVLATDRRSGRETPIAAGSGIEAEERRAKAVFAAIGHDHGSRAQTAIRFALANPDIACVIVGLATLSHLEEALGAAEMGPLPEPALDRLDRFHGTEFAGL